MTTFVLVHGALHNSGCWHRVVGPLRNSGHAVDAVDLVGCDDTSSPDFRTYVDVVASAVQRAAPPVVLVGHSLGGVTVSQFVDDRPDAVAGLVLVNAVLVEDGEAALEKIQTAGEECVFMRPGALRFSDDGSTVSVPSDLAVDGFYNRCERPDAAWAAGLLRPEPVPPLLVPLRIGANFRGVRKIYLASRHDRVLPWWLQEKMSKAAGARLIELSGDHSPFYSVPDELVGHFLDIETEWSRR
jgi:pimeloyl-ACP methyl ester carboxylesterase